MASRTLGHKIARYEEVKRSGVDYILEHENPDGSFGPVENGFFFYRLPWTFLVAGETRAALGICRWVRENMPDGGWRLRPRPAQDDGRLRVPQRDLHLRRAHGPSVRPERGLHAVPPHPQGPNLGGIRQGHDAGRTQRRYGRALYRRIGAGLHRHGRHGLGPGRLPLPGQPVGAAGRAAGPPLLQHVQADPEGDQGVPAGGAPLERRCRPGRGDAALGRWAA